jgi:hypothetical protein
MEHLYPAQDPVRIQRKIPFVSIGRLTTVDTLSQQYIN